MAKYRNKDGRLTDKTLRQRYYVNSWSVPVGERRK